MMAMRRAVIGLSIQPDFVAVDGNRVPQWEYPPEAVVKGDGRVEVISAASILAKVIRDAEMVSLRPSILAMALPKQRLWYSATY